MSPPKPEKLRRKLDALRSKGGIKSSEMESFARSVGRKQVKRGKEKNWINPSFPELFPVSIPHHSKGLKKATARSILNQLEEDIVAMEFESERVDADA